MATGGGGEQPDRLRRRPGHSRSMSEYPKIRQRLIDMGLADIVPVYQDAYDRFMNRQQTQRIPDVMSGIRIHLR